MSVTADPFLPYGWSALKTLAVGFLLLCAVVSGNSLAAVPPAFLKKGANLQKVLDTTGELWLAPDIDYRGFGSKPLKVPSGAKILGRWNARLPVLVIAGGVHDVWIEGLDGAGSEEPDIVFTGGMPNRNITIIGGNGGRIGIAGRLKVRLEDDSRVDGLDLAEYGALEVLQGNSGYVRNSVFSHALGYRPGSTVWWEGNEEEPNSGNSFLHISSITPQWKSHWNRAGPLFMLSWDCEAWNGNGKGDVNCFEVVNSPSVISMGLSGGTAYSAQGGALAKIQDVGLVVDFSSRPRGGVREAADLLFENVSDNYHVFRSEIRVVDRTPGSIRIGDLGLDDQSLLAPKRPTGPSSEIQALLRGHVFPPTAGLGRNGVFAQPMPSSSPVAKLNYHAGVLDQSAFLQQLIDQNGVARIAPGIYWLSRSLKIGSMLRAEGLVASGPGEVVLAATGHFPIIEGRGTKDISEQDPRVRSIVLSGVAMVGGSHGVLWNSDAGNIGPGRVIASSTFEHLRFNGQSVAGVAALGTGGLDSNSWRRVLFENMPTAIMGLGKGADAGMNYADKQGFMLCSFRNIRDAVWSWDSERPSGGNFWYRSEFENVGNVSRTRAAYNMIWFASTFRDVHGDLAFKMLDNGSTATGDFFVISGSWTGEGPAVVTSTASWGLGTFLLGSEFRQKPGMLVSSRSDDALVLWRSRVSAGVNGLFPERHLVINSVIADKATGFSIGSREGSAR
jgi:hypothetical protein